MAFLPDGRMLITERPGRLRVFANGRLEPRAAGRRAQGPCHAARAACSMSACIRTSRRTACSTSPIRGEGAGGSGDHGGARRAGRRRPCAASRTIFEALPRAPGGLHFGSRIVFDRAGLMYVTTGERYQMQRAQDLGDLGGKIVRLSDDGSVPPDNPFVGRPGARPEIFTWGHRNPQGLALHPETGRIWEVEHGPARRRRAQPPEGRRQLRLAAGHLRHRLRRQPVITRNKSLPGMEDPLRVWVPSISPCGLCFYTGDKFPGWKGSLFTGALSNYALFRIELDGERYRSEERLLVDRLPYIRDVRQGPDGLLYLVTHSDDGGLFRLEPA